MTNMAIIYVDENTARVTKAFMGEGSVGDTMTAHFYDCDNQLIGDIVFKKN